MPARTSRAILAALAASAVVATLAGCVANDPGAAVASSVQVSSTADACDVSVSSVPSGSVSFTITNSAEVGTEFYLLADDKQRIVGEQENVAPGAPRDLTLSLPAGDYFTACKPGMAGDGVGIAAFTVTESAAPVASSEHTAMITDAETTYVAYVRDQISQLVPGTQAFLAAYLAGDDESARSLYAITRANYERVEPVAESFGHLDPAIDFREADVPDGDTWTGWHRIEKDLWPPADPGYVALTTAERTQVAAKLTTDTQALADAVNATDYSVSIDAISNGAIALMDEVASGKITGEEEIWSHTDLWDFQANLEGARVAYEGVREVVVAQDSDLAADLDLEFDALQTQLAAYGSLEAGFVRYTDLPAADIRRLADGVNALSEPLSRLTATLVS